MITFIFDLIVFMFAIATFYISIKIYLLFKSKMIFWLSLAALWAVIMRFIFLCGLTNLRWRSVLSSLFYVFLFLGLYNLHKILKKYLVQNGIKP